MNRQRKPRSRGRVSEAPRVRQKRAPSAPTGARTLRPASSPAEEAVLALLSELLIGDDTWTIAQVQRLIAVRDLAELGWWRTGGLDEAGASTR